ncbi:hypothetical protein OG590_00605 [Streptomyces goshikiensis]|nr:hypothetical protein OG590_00605 [Streptomyces goshikiensis]
MLCTSPRCSAWYRGTRHILDVLDVLHRDRLALRINDGEFSAMDLTGRTVIS